MLFCGISKLSIRKECVMSFDINSLQSTAQSIVQPFVSQNRFNSAYGSVKNEPSAKSESVTENPEPLNSFAEEDEAIISAEAKMQYALEEFNSGGDNVVELMATSLMAKTTVEMEVNVINTKKEMMDEILHMGE